MTQYQGSNRHSVTSDDPADAAPGLGWELVAEGLDLFGEVGVGGGKRGVKGNELLACSRPDGQPQVDKQGYGAYQVEATSISCRKDE